MKIENLNQLPLNKSGKINKNDSVKEKVKL